RLSRIGPSSVESWPISLKSRFVRWVPGFDGRGRPLRGFVCVAAVAGIGSAERLGKIRPRHSKTVIMPLIDHHIGSYRHVTRYARHRRINTCMVMMRCRRISLARMALQADIVARGPQFGRVRLVAIAASHAGREHPALLERSVVVDLILH